MASEYSVLVKAILDMTAVDAKLKQPRTMPISAKLQGGDALNITLGKLQNQLDGIKIKNADAFKNKDVISMGGSVQGLIKKYDGSKKSLGEIQVAMGELRNKTSQVNDTFRTTTSSTDNFATSMGKIIGKIALWGVATGLLYGSLHQLQEGVQYVKDLNREMTNIGLVSGQTTEQLSGLATELNNKAKELGASTLDTAKGYVEWARQGRTAAESMILLTNSTMLSKLGNLDAADATTKLTAAINAYGISVEDSIDIVDVLVRLDQEFATSTAEIASGMEKSSSMAKQAGVNYKDLASYITVVSSITRQSGDTIGQAFSR